jgi:RNA polymerase sigma factor (sigma-70 family)
LKRGGGLNVTLDESIEGRSEAIIDMLVLDQALDRLAAAEPRWAQVVELRFFTGLEIAEVAGVLGTSPATVKRDWQFARAWLAREWAMPRRPRLKPGDCRRRIPAGAGARF